MVIFVGGDNLKKSTVQITVKISDECNKKLEMIAKQSGIYKSEIIRKFIEQGMSDTGYKQSEEQALKNMEIALRQILDPAINRIVAVSVKGGITSSAAYFLAATALSAFVHPDVRPDFNDAIITAKKLGVEYMRVKDSIVDEFLETGTNKIKQKYMEE